MLTAFARLFVLIGVLGFAAPAGSQIATPRSLQQWTPEVSVSVRYVLGTAGPLSLVGWGDSLANSGPIVWSPTRKYFLFVTRHGDFQTDSNVYELNIYKTEEVRDWLANAPATPPPSPFRRVSRHTRIWRSPPFGIDAVRWSQEENSVYFLAQEELAQEETGRSQVFELELASSRLHQRTHHAPGVRWYAVGGEGLIFGDHTNATLTAAYPVEAAERVSTAGDGGDLLGAAVNSGRFNFSRGEERIYFAHSGREPRLFPYQSIRPSRLWISPNGRYAIVFVDFRFELIELSSFRTRPLSIGVAPPKAAASDGLAPFPSVLWSDDSENVAITQGVDLRAQSVRPAVVAYNVSNRAISSVQASDGPVNAVWSSPRELQITSGTDANAARSVRYRFGLDGQLDGPPIEIGPTAASHSDLHIEVRQSANDSPNIVAFLEEQTSGRPLLAPDPALDGLWMAQQTPFQWQEGDQVITGGLYLPRYFEPGRPVPLVVQPYRYLPESFLPDGETTSGDAAQLLAAHGFAVLKYDIPPSGEDEGPAAVRRFDAAVSALVAARIADPNRIGLTGFSRSGYQTYYIITHPGRTRVSAAVSLDGFKGSYADYLAFAAVMGDYTVTIHNNFELGPGGPFRGHEQSWLQYETSFNVDHVSSPLLVTSNGGDVAYFEGRDNMYWDSNILPTIGAFVLNRRPLEYFYFREGSHNLQRPRERIAALEATLDWMNFWLQDRQDPSPAKIEQYRRWMRLRADWQRQQAWEAAGNEVGSRPPSDFQPVEGSAP